MIISEQAPASGGTQKAGSSLVGAIAWAGASMWITQILSWATTIYVARVLSPNDYGLFALASVYLGLVSLVSELGIGSAVIVLRDLGDRQLAGLNTVSVIAGFVWLILSVILARPIGAFFTSDELPLLIVVMSVAFLITSFKVVPDSQLRRELRFKLVAHIEGTKALLQLLFTIAAAWAGLRYWSLVIGYLVGAAAETILTLVCRRHYFAWPNLGMLKPALMLSRDLLLTRICWYVYTNSDFVIAGRLLGQAPLGAYRLAWSISNIPVDKVAAMVMRTSQAFFSDVQKDYSSLRRYLLTLTEGLGLVTIPASMGIVLVADQFVPLVLGDSWTEAILPLRLLALYAAARSITPLIPTILTVTGNSAYTARVTFWTSLILPVGFVIGARWGAAGIAAAWVIMYPISTIPLYRRAFAEIGLRFREYFSALRVAFVATVFMTLAVSALRYGLASSVPSFASLVLQAVTGLIAYVGYIALFHRPRVRAFAHTIRLLRHVAPKQAVPAS
jgi:O-antigen/teichoic acid export membrane protein